MAEGSQGRKKNGPEKSGPTPEVKNKAASAVEGQKSKSSSGGASDKKPRAPRKPRTAQKKADSSKTADKAEQKESKPRSTSKKTLKNGEVSKSKSGETHKSKKTTESKGGAKQKGNSKTSENKNNKISRSKSTKSDEGKSRKLVKGTEDKRKEAPKKENKPLDNSHQAQDREQTKVIKESDITKVSMYSNLGCLSIDSKLVLGNINFMRTSIGYEMKNISYTRTVVLKDVTIRPRETAIVLYSDLKEFREITQKERFGHYDLGVNFEGIVYLETQAELKLKEVVKTPVNPHRIVMTSEYRDNIKVKKAVDERVSVIASKKWDDGYAEED